MISFALIALNLGALVGLALWCRRLQRRQESLLRRWQAHWWAVIERAQEGPGG